MSNAVYPVLNGLTWPVGLKPSFNTIKQRAVAGQEVRVQLMSYPLYDIALQYDYVPASTLGTDWATLLDFFLARGGAFDNFLFDNVDDDTIASASPQQFGLGDGTTVAFQLTRYVKAAGFTEPVMNLNGTPTILDNGAAAGAHTIDSSGVVTFSVAPVAGHSLTWYGSYYYRCRFADDMVDLNQFMKNFWEARKVNLVGSLGIKI